MSSVKELKSIDLSSYTIIMTGIAVVLSIIVGILLTIGFGIISGSIGVGLYILPTIIVGAFMISIYNRFSNGLFYNLLAKKFNTVKFTFDNENELVKVSTTETAVIISIITLIQSVLIYLVSMLIVPISVNALIQTLMLTGQDSAAYSLYQLLMLYNQPATALLFLFGSFVISFVLILLGTYIYNLLGTHGRGIIVNLSKEGDLTAVDSIDPFKLAIAFAAVFAVLNIVSAIILIIIGGNVVGAIGDVISGILSGFVIGIIFAVLYNYLAPKLGKLKLELIDQ